jgi:energy-coupling factor transport system ATP-binding protein
VWLPHRSAPARREPKAQGAALLFGEGLTVARPRGPAIAVGDLTVRAGTALALTGVNGAGKSTLALALGGLLPPVSGTLTACEGLRAGLGASPFAWRSSALVSRIGSVFQNPEHQFVAATVRDELAVGPRAAGIRGRRADAVIDDVLARLRLDSLARANPFTLSGGQKRRLSVATAIVTAPRMLVLDEPTFGQDAVTWGELVGLLADLRDGGSAVVCATHDEELVNVLDAERHELTVGAPLVGAP